MPRGGTRMINPELIGRFPALSSFYENYSSKMKKFNLIGVPYQIIIGKKSEGDLFEFKEIGKESQNLSIDQISELINKQKEKI